MWFMNKIINPLVRLILRSPVHKIMSDTLLIITCCGRKTGREYSLPVQYAQTGNILYIVPGMPKQKTWWRNLIEAAPVQLTLRGQHVAGTARVLKPETDSEAILEGFGLYLRHFPALIKSHNIPMAADGSFNAEGLRRAAAQAVIIRVELNQP
jgi:deazaflavin-dependent oxidoreductase (nitroreductase family)